MNQKEKDLPHQMENYLKQLKLLETLKNQKKRKPKKMRRNTIMHITMDMMMEYKIKNIMKNMILHQVKIAKKVIGMDLLMEVIIENMVITRNLSSRN